jgi:hypothetical protein
MRYFTRVVFSSFALLLGAAAYANSSSDPRADSPTTYRSSDRDEHGSDKQDKDHEDRDRQCKDRGHRDEDRDGRHRADDDDDCSCKADSSTLATAAPGASLQDANTLLSAFAIVNTGTKRKDGVSITSVSLAGAQLTLPTSLPYQLGTLLAGSSAILNADFSGKQFLPDTTYTVSVRGTYSHEHERRCFKLNVNLTIPPAAPGSAPLQTATVGPNKVAGGLFPHQPLDFEDDVNTAGWTVPTGPFTAGTPTATATIAQIATLGDPPAVDFLKNTSLGLTSGGSNGTFANSGSVEPSGAASGGGVVFVTANWAAAYSTDGGATFTQLDPTTIFPADAVGFCCDQIAQYVPSIDRFVWLLQGNGDRIATASPADIISSKGTAWTYWNLTPGVFNHPGSFDYPDMAVGDNYLYMSWNAGGCSNCDSGHQVVRTSLAGLQAGGSIELDYTDPKNSGNAWGAHLSQNTGNEIFWAGHNSNSGMRIYSLQEGSNTYFWQDIGIATWANNSPLSSTSPDGLNWLNFLFNPTTQNPGGGFPANAVLGSTRSFNQVWFAWSAGTDKNFQRPHVEMVSVNIDDANPPSLSVQQQVQIWNNSYSFAYPALATNACTGEVGLSLEGGGDGNFENHLVGFWGDFLAYITTNSNVGDTRYGDYVTIRQQPPTDANPGNLFSAFGFGLNSVPPPGSGTQSDVHYVLFGRPASSCQRIG